MPTERPLLSCDCVSARRLRGVAGGVAGVGIAFVATAEPELLVTVATLGGMCLAIDDGDDDDDAEVASCWRRSSMQRSLLSKARFSWLTSRSSEAVRLSSAAAAYRLGLGK